MTDNIIRRNYFYGKCIHTPGDIQHILICVMGSQKHHLLLYHPLIREQFVIIKRSLLY